MNKLKAITRSVSFNSRPNSTSSSNKNNGREKDKLEPTVGFKLTLYSSASDNTSSSVPELEVQLIGARHLPSKFGLKTVEGYMIKVKLFPGTSKFDSSIQTSSWPKFNESFRFPLGSSLKSSMKSKYRDFQDINGNETLPQKLFKGTFVVFTVIALLELPSGSHTGIKGTYKSLKRQGSIILRERINILSTNLNLTSSTTATDKTDKNKNVSKMAASETQRNIGAVTLFLDPKTFEENIKNKTYETNEMWLPIRDISVAPNTKLSAISSPKGQVEIILELCDNSSEEDLSSKYDKNLNPFESDTNSASTSKPRFSFSDVKLPNVKKFMKPKREHKNANGLCLKVTTSKMRCSIKVKEEFENYGEKIYLKTTVFEHDILSDSWKSELFIPTLSIRWDQTESTINIPLVNEDSLEHISIKTTVAMKTKLGKKIVLGTLYIRPDLDDLEQWATMLSTRNIPIPMWYSFE
ncbi:hypothetical protein PVAND_010486 [Polypedilum vanderplanki]|uniref:C2 domain-containing protein n=1 Tax=Polypedilum vanderplanki TaxID=319348 RepID=A0A9J6CG31_POLVA|nr:hypothetical protein PVAND_010486 [Polypedilum vanderplanki]